MQQKWKCIIANWINCYFYDNNNKNYFELSHESLLNIIYQLRENFKLDESKSSIFSGHSLEEFIQEKYPGFKFESGTVEANNEEETYIAASLLLFFVCVNSKDVDIKSAMCSKLSTSDQEIILKFSKSLMKCSLVSSSDVIAAITEACGPDMANGQGGSGQVTVAETPPALRSLHGEVRRLQAALEAERFDRNYLQDELTRTNLKLEKLLKDNEKYKLDNVNLKAKISMCCGQEAEARQGETESRETAKFTKQLEQMEQRMIDAQEQLEEAQHERDMLKAKLDELKGECDRLLMVNQQETSRAAQLADELEAEKRQSQALRELVVELRQHNHRNGLDSSMLECDDPDTSVSSLQRSFSVCSEVCANVVEVQLGEERAKSLALKQQIQMLQDQINEQLQTIENFKATIADKNDNIFNLNLRINEEIEEKNNLKHYFDCEVTKLNNSVNELEQKLKDDSEHSRRIIDKKMQEIQTIQEEKLSLLQSLSDETTKLENIIKDLKIEIDVERTSKIKMRDDYENHIMKLKEKVLNRNNELVELQNNVLQKSEMIEQLSLELRKEREIKDETVNKHNNDLAFLNAQKISVENDLQNKCTEVTELLKQIRQRDTFIEDMAKDLKYAKESASKLIEDCKILEEIKQTLLKDIQNRESSAEKMRKEFENLTNKHCEEKDKLQYKFDEMCAMVNSLQTQLQDEIDFKMRIQHELENAQGVVTKLSNTNTKLHSELTEMTSKLQENNGILKEKELFLNEEIEKYIRLKQEYDHVKVELDKLSSDVALKDKTIQECEDKLQKLNKSLQEEVSNKEKIIDSLKEDLKHVIAQKETLQDSIKTLSLENNKLVKSFNEKCSYISLLESERETLSQKMEEKGATIHMLEQKLNDKMLAFVQIEDNFRIEISKLVTKVSETEKMLKEVRTQSDSIIENNESRIQKLNGDIFKLQGQIEASAKEKTKLESEKERLEQKLEELTLYNSNIVRECQDNCKTLEKHLENLKYEIVVKDKEINDLTRKNIILSSSITEKEKELSILQDSNQEWQTKKDIMDEYLKNEKDRLHTMLEEQINKNKEIEEELKVKAQTICRLEEKLKAFESIIGTLEKEKENYLTILAKLEKQQNEIENEKTCLERERERLIIERNEVQSKFVTLKKEFGDVESEMIKLKEEKFELLHVIEKNKSVMSEMEKNIQSGLNDKEELCHALTVEKSKLSTECTLLQEQQLKDAEKIEKLSKELNEYQQELNTYSNRIQYFEKAKTEQDILITTMEQQMNCLEIEKEQLINEKINYLNEITKLEEEMEVLKNTEIPKLKEENLHLTKIIEENKIAIDDLEKRLEHELEQNDKLRQNYDSDKINVLSKCDSLQKNIDKMGQELQNRNIQMKELKGELEVYISKANTFEEELKQSKREFIEINEEKDIKLQDLTKDLESERTIILQYKKEIESKDDIISDLKHQLGEIETVKKELETLRIEKEEFIETLRRKEEVMSEMEKNIQSGLNDKEELCHALTVEKSKLSTECTLLQEQQLKDAEKIEKLSKELNEYQQELNTYSNRIQYLEKAKTEQDSVITNMEQQKHCLEIEKEQLMNEKINYLNDITKLEEEMEVLKNTEIPKLKEENLCLTNIIEENKIAIDDLEKRLEHELGQNDKLRQNYDSDKINVLSKCDSLQKNIDKMGQELQNRNIQMKELKGELEVYISKANTFEEELKQSKREFIEINEERDIKLQDLTKDLESERTITLQYKKEIESKDDIISDLKQQLGEIETVKKELETLRIEKEEFTETLRRKEEECTLLQSENDEWKIKKDMLEAEFKREKNALQHALKLQMENNQKLESDLQLKGEYLKEIEEKLKLHDITINELKSCNSVQDKLVLDLEKEKIKLKDENEALESEKCILVQKKNEYMTKLNKLQTEFDILKNEELTKLKEENLQLTSIVENNKTVISTLERLIKKELEQNEVLRKDFSLEKLELVQKCKFLQENHTKVEQELEKRNTEINALKEEIRVVTLEAKGREENLRYNNEQLTKIIEEKDATILQMNEVLLKEKIFREEYQKQIELKENNIYELQQKLKGLEDEVDVLRTENKQLFKHVKQIESNAASSQEKSQNQQCCSQAEKYQCDLHSKVDTTSSTNHTHSSVESNKTISDLEKILNDKNRTITTLQTDIAFLKSLMAESENKVLDVSKELEISKENCQQLSNQLKKIVYQKNEEISELKKQVSKMSATENRASQIIRVSAKYQEIILKRIAEIKCNTVLKELTNFGNTANCDNELKRSLNAGTITMEDLENFLETTDRHLRRCSEKRIALQKERDRLVEVNRINESEIINIKKFLTELSVSVKTFNSVKDVYTQKLSRVVSIQRTVRREVLSMEGRLTDSTMCKLERAYAAVLQDLVECTMNLERWVERSIGRAISAEKIKQAFTSENERASLAPSTFQNASLEVQMDELEKSFHKILEEVARAQRGDGAKDAQSLTVQELRTEYEDKLTRMKAKMKELYYEQIDIFKAKQREEIIMLEQELQKTRDKLEESSKAYEEHIRSLLIELWKLGEKFLNKQDEAEWLKRKQRSESLMSLQHVHSSGLVAQPEVSSRASDTHSLRSLPVNINKKSVGCGLHMSDEEGEVFDNRCLRELETPRRSSPQRLSELRYRNSLCPPHLKSSYPAETQFVPALHEEDIKAGPTNSSVGVRQQRKEVGITAYKKPGPPTPSKQAGRLSATDSELRESVRVETDPHASRKTTTPSRLRSFFGTTRNDAVEGTPRSRRLSNFFRKK